MINILDAYPDELKRRFNNRDNPWLFRDTLLKLLNAEHVKIRDSNYLILMGLLADLGSTSISAVQVLLNRLSVSQRRNQLRRLLARRYGVYF